MKQFLLLIFICSTLLHTNAQQPLKPSSVEIFESIQKLNFLGSVLYLAAHPDDENTRLISYFSNKEKARTAYLSITRGDGGQNLIGSELRELLGVIRTQELLAARRIDGGEQFFTRANDFGYSKHPDETLQFWDKEEVLKDVVAIIRKFKPDIIINRFNTASAGKTHGHHTSSALLSTEAFELIGDSNYKGHNMYQPWKAKRLFFNTTRWFYGSKERFAKADKSNMLVVDTGVYFPLTGKSNTEIAALSRSQHQSQGFGNTGTRGSQLAYLEFLKGDKVKDKTNIFEGINTTWTRVEGGVAIEKILSKVLENYKFKNPSASIPELLKAYELISNLKDKHWKELKLKQIKDIILACSGLYLEAVATQANSFPDGKIAIKIEAINRSSKLISLKKIEIPSLRIVKDSMIDLANNRPHNFTFRGTIPTDISFTNPYWLNQRGTLGMYKVLNKKFIGNPETPRKIKVNFNLDVDGYSIDIQKDITYKYNDPVKGEVYQPFEIIPKVTTKIADKVFIFVANTSKEIPITVQSHSDSFNGTVSLNVPNGWQVTPKQKTISISHRDGEQTILFKLTPPPYQEVGSLSANVQSNLQNFSKEMVTIQYNHIPKQTILFPAQSKIVRLDIEKKGQRIGYIRGAGDQIPTSLRQIGYTVIELNESDISLENLQNFDAVILGIRAYNINKRAKFYQKTLHEYAKNGGTLIVQYNTNRRLKVAQVAPYPLELSRDRVVDEKAKVTLINTSHEVLNYPNKITTDDFKGWVQERGLYFPYKWSSEFTPVLMMKDKGESSKKGSLLVAKYGKGHFIYTGLSFFRELPAGVPGAYKLFANMISIGKNNNNKTIKK